MQVTEEKKNEIRQVAKFIAPMIVVLAADLIKAVKAYETRKEGTDISKLAIGIFGDKISDVIIAAGESGHFDNF